MPHGRSWTATCERVPGGWEVRVPGLGASGRAALLTQVEDVARELVRSSAPDGDPPRVLVEPVVPTRLRALLEAAQRVRAEADSVAIGDVITRRRLARSLAEEGFPVPDVAVLLGVSEARVRMLTAGAVALTVPPSGAGPVTPAASGARSAPVALVDARAGGGADATLAADATLGADSSADEGLAARESDSRRSHRHEALFHSGDSDLVEKALPFLREGVVQGEPVLAALPGPRLELLRRALGADAARVHLVDMADVGRNPARIIPAWLEFLDQYGGRPARGLGQPVWPGRTAAEVAECHLHEALLNVAVDPDRPAWLRCCYDVAALGDDVLDAALCSHPLVVEGESPRGSTRYAGLAYVEELLASPLPAPVERPAETAFGRDDVAAVRTLVHRWGREADLGQDRAADLALAVTELATNSIRHGGGSGRLRSWREEGGLAVEVSDAGRVGDPLVGRRAPDWSQEGGRGLWLAHQLCDLVQLRTGPGGTTVRVSAGSRRAR